DAADNSGHGCAGIVAGCSTGDHRSMSATCYGSVGTVVSGVDPDEFGYFAGTTRAVLPNARTGKSNSSVGREAGRSYNLVAQEVVRSADTGVQNGNAEILSSGA